jgi:tetratricopeptide (TPR) repeat protein
MITISRSSSILALLFLVLGSVSMYAQPGGGGTGIALARQYIQNKEYDKAIPVLKQVYEQAPFDKGVYDEYFDVLLLAGKYEDAGTLVQYMMKIRREDPVMMLDLGRVYEAEGKKKLAEEQYEAALAKVSGGRFSYETAC